MNNLNKSYKVLIADLVGLKFDVDGMPDHSAVKAHIEAKGGRFHLGPHEDKATLEDGVIHFFYCPNLSREEEILPITQNGQYDAAIVAATFMPKGSLFPEGGVRIGAGTGNMACECWGGGNGTGGSAPLMNTPSFNSRATAQMAMKALLKVIPDIDVEELHAKVCKGDFDTGKNLADYPTEKVEGKTLAVIGYGNIGREVANLGKAFGMNVRVYARPHHKKWIESEGFQYAETLVEAASGADVLSPHTGLGALDPQTGTFANAGIINADVLNAMNDGAVLINYDRGEVVDTNALGDALTAGKIRHAAIDADLFKSANTGELSGPMVPYLSLLENHADKLELLPHAAADTEHVSRVEGAKQAVDQIIACITERKVINLKGDLPDGYSHGGPVTVRGVGKVSPSRLADAASDAAMLTELAELSRFLADTWTGIEMSGSGSARETAMEIGEELILKSNRYITLIEKLGLKGPYG